MMPLMFLTGKAATLNDNICNLVMMSMVLWTDKSNHLLQCIMMTWQCLCARSMQGCCILRLMPHQIQSDLKQSHRVCAHIQLG